MSDALLGVGGVGKKTPGVTLTYFGYLAQVYLEDATLARSWIEHDGCKEFVANILTAFPDVDVVGALAFLWFVELNLSKNNY